MLSFQWFFIAVIGIFTVANASEARAPFTFGEKRAVNLGFPQYPEDVLAKIENKTKKPSANRVDSMLSEDWGLSNIGFFEVFTPLVQPVKLGTVSCNPEVVVAVVDTGIDYTHPELSRNLWVNKGETGAWKPAPGKTDSGCRDKSCNGEDDDGNGFSDDVIGWDFVNNIPFPYDTHGHGTHIAGIISGEGGNGIGATGICPSASVMALKYYDASGIGYNNLQNTVKAIQYAVKMGADMINYSGGGADPAIAERLAVEEAQKKGILFIAAAGNDGHNNDYQPYYPSSYPLDNIISVASINQKGQLLPSSNFGKGVQVAAPGLSVLSALPNGRFGTMSGTSQATAFVTGAAALLVSQSKVKPSYQDVKKWVLDGARPLKGNDSRKLLTYGILNIPGSLKARSEASAPAIAVKSK